MVTTALTLSHGLLFNPPRRLGSPVPPPKHPTLNCRRRISQYCTRWHYHWNLSVSFQNPFMPPSTDSLERDLRDIFGGRLQSFVAYGTHAYDASLGHQAHGDPHAADRRVVHTLA